MSTLVINILSQLALIVNLTQPRVVLEERPRWELPGPNWPVGKSVGMAVVVH